MRRCLFWLVLLCMLVAAGPGYSQQAATTFTNPLLPSGADPWSVYKDGYYYYTHTTGRNITLWKTKSLDQLRNAPSRVVWTPPATGPNSRDIWAPELHFLSGKWYIYYSAAGTNSTHRLWVLENPSPDPLQGTWTAIGKLSGVEDKWAIDGSVFKHKRKLYLVWSGWEGDKNGQQNIYISRLKNPTTIKGPRAKISSPTYPWERDGDLDPNNDPPHVDVNEGPEVLGHGNKLFLVYSASGCWTDAYSLGMLTARANANLLKARSWQKSPEPVFKQTPENGVFAPGHNSFFKSPDGKEDWILYHANDKPGQGCGNLRSPRAQPFTWNADGTPNFGQPISTQTPLPRPSGE